MIGCVYDYTKKYRLNTSSVEPNISRERDTKKKEIARAECAFFGRGKHARENPRARGDGDDDNT